ncbi:hypothetical protein MMC14_002926 [Varicellaria rhodocarpa]|nr:hypothetical protein [Varicellaria rhodocarpa]
MPSMKNLVLLAFVSFTAAQSQISDGQVQAPTTTLVAVSEFTDGQPQVTSTVAGVSEFTDGQPQVTSTVAGVSEFTDGQPQVTSTVAAVSEFTDGQPQVTSTVVAVSEFTDGQPQVTSTVAAVSEFTDGQPQVTTTLVPSLSILPTATSNGTFTASAPISTFTGAASLFGWNKEVAGVAVGLAVAALL